jgi:hypothetical protein
MRQHSQPWHCFKPRNVLDVIVQDVFYFCLPLNSVPSTSHTIPLQGFRLGRPFSILLKKKLNCPKEPRPNLPNVLRFYDQIGRCLSVFLSYCSGTLSNDYTVFWVATFSGCSPSLCEHVKKVLVSKLFILL